MNVYQWKAPLAIKGGGKHANAQVVGEALEKIRNANGDLDTKDVVEAARPRRSPLHKHFTWDDTIAAEAYRRHQARHLVSSLRLVNANSNEEMRPYISVMTRQDGVHYRPHYKVVGDGQLQSLLLAQALGELKAMRTRYRSLVELCVLLDRIITEFDEEGGEAAA